MPAWLEAYSHSWWGLLGSAFVLSFLGGFLPVFSVELYLVSISALAGHGMMFPVVFGCTLGQVVSKAFFYYAGSGVIRMPFRNQAAALERWRERMQNFRFGKDALLFLSAFIGVPPYYVTPILAGTLRLGLTRFVVTSLIGRALRFGLIYAFPSVLRRWL